MNDVVTACAAVLTDADASAALLDAIPAFVAAEAAYIEQGEAQQLFSIAGTATVNGVLTRKQMSRLYKGTFARKGSSVRTTFYDRLKVSAPHGICPSCGERNVASLDHYLPKKLHPAFAVTPVNLVPCCSDCNKAKAATEAEAAEDQFLHPYFDEVDDGVWLKAELLPGEPPALVFRADPPQAWDAIKRARIANHFDLLGLSELFTALGGRLITDIAHRVSRLRDQGGPDAVRDYLNEEAETRREVVTNSWQIAAYEALSQSDEYCDG